MIFQATVTLNQDPSKAEHYVGLSSTTFKERLANHHQTFKKPHLETKTELSKHIWALKRKKIEYDVQFKFLYRAKPFSPVSGICNLCICEKYYINFHPELATINKKDEINGFCKHKSKQLLDKT